MRLRGFRIKDFSGKEFTLPASCAHYEKIAENGPDTLLLGAGPGWQEFCAAQKKRGRIFILQSPALLVKEGEFSRADSPAAKMIDVRTAIDVFNSAAAFFYKPAMRLDPAFWEKTLGLLEAKNARGATRKRLIWLPGDDGRLLQRELRLALTEMGFSTLERDFSKCPAEFMRQEVLPQFVISVNFHGLDAEGRIFNFCRAANIPVAVWLVDNPWNLLSGIKLPWWHNASLFVTDPSFIPDLQKIGAKNPHFLPLAAARHFFGQEYDGLGPPVFVGRSEFPDKKRFFAAAAIEPQLLEEADHEFARGDLPDFHWWQKRLSGELWPGFACRNPGFGAETFSQKNRSRWLRAGSACGMEIYGDSGWSGLVAEAVVHPPVDYYGSLAQIYARAGAVLNVTSLLLPQSLSQRHFDVWAARGFLLSDATCGLNIFPTELVRPITVENPSELAGRLEHFLRHPGARREITESWREEIAARHLYLHRLEKMLKILETEN